MRTKAPEKSVEYVKAFSAKYRGGGESLGLAAPRSPCNPRVLPTQPTNLAITPGNGQLGICWGPHTTGCPDTYRVGVRLADASRRAAPLVREYPQGGCVNVTSLQNGEFYEVRTGRREGGIAQLACLREQSQGRPRASACGAVAVATPATGCRVHPPLSQLR